MELVVDRTLSRERALELVGTELTPDLVREVWSSDDEPLRVLDGETGAVVLHWTPRATTEESSRTAFRILEPIRARSAQRFTALVGGSQPFQTKGDGTVTRFHHIDYRAFPHLRHVSQALLGFYDRTPRYPFARATSWTSGHPEEWAELQPWIREVAEVYRRAEPERAAAQQAFADRVHPAWIVPGTPFSTLTVNRNFATRCHVDGNDVPEGLGCMATLRGGTYEGGELVFPGYGLALDMRSGGVLLANVHEPHGNLPLRGTPGRYARLTTIFYLRRNLTRCSSPEEELARVKNRPRTGAALYDDADVTEDHPGAS